MRSFLFLILLIATLFVLWILTSCHQQHKAINSGGLTWKVDTTIVINGWAPDTLYDPGFYSYEPAGDTLVIPLDDTLIISKAITDTGWTGPKVPYYPDRGIDPLGTYPPGFSIMPYYPPKPRPDTVDWKRVFPPPDTSEIFGVRAVPDRYWYFLLYEAGGAGEVLSIDGNGKLHVKDSLLAIQMLIKDWAETQKYLQKNYFKK